jgi:hypothetical protein
LAEKKGYILVGCDTSGTNAFFIRKDVAENKLTAVSVQTAFFPSLTRSEKMSQAEQFALLANMPFEEV